MTDYTDPERSIGRRSIGAGSARTALLRRDYDAPVDDVWDACTDRERLSRWFLPVSGDLRLGGSFSLEGNASGEVLRCEPPQLLAVSWKYGDHPVDELELRLSPKADGGTTLEIEHATISDRTEWEGRSYDSIFGIGTGWEPALYALEWQLAGTLTDDVAEAWRAGRLPSEVDDLVARSERAWTAIVEASGNPAVRG
jgi:uncharacterized protein YndB with AHSA1/START domain